MRAWVFNDDGSDQRELHQHDPVQFVDLDAVNSLGVQYQYIPLDEQNTTLKKLREERGYDYDDVVNCCPEKLENYDQKIKSFFVEHIHSDEEIRYVLDGSGYFDVRDTEDRWVRVEVETGDLLIVPAGIYHRFTMDTKNYIKAQRLFSGVPVWTPINRVDDADKHPARKQYIKEHSNSGFSCLVCS
eukprot:GFYU01011089.1.p1 GENE.GFYU01011089.1~~GFYU01011089.1.p1  ORF type:complete len:186 (-),score=44.53 GFYU01011089.1:172-729(-)